MPANPSRVDRSHEYIRDVAYRERGRALHDLRAALAQYAHRQRWQSLAVPLANGNVQLWAAFDGGWGVAEAALARWAGVNDTDAE